jgi:hypothetical protein
MAASVGEGPSYVDPAASEVDIADAQRGSLTPAQPRITEDQDKHLPGSSFRRQITELIVGEEHVVAAESLRQA